jgi:ankyrin repeat protein
MIKKIIFLSMFLAVQFATPLSFYFPDFGAQKLSMQIEQAQDMLEMCALIKTELAEYDQKVQQHILDYCLACSVELEDFVKAKILIKSGANPNTRGFRHSRAMGSSKSLLMERAECGSAAQVKFLLKYGGHTGDRDSRGAHVWHHAVNNRQFNNACAIFRALADQADNQADSEPGGTEPGNINYPGAYGDTALHEAARSAKLFFVRELVLLGADINAQDDKGFTPLDTILDRVRWGDLEHGHKRDYIPVIQFLCERGARSDYYSMPDFLRESDILPEENRVCMQEAQQFLVPRDRVRAQKEEGRVWRSGPRFLGRKYGDGGADNYQSEDEGGCEGIGDAYVLLEDGLDGAQGQDVRVSGRGKKSSERTCVIM